MNKLFVACLLMLGFIPALAQNNGSSSIFGGKSLSLGFYVMPGYQLSSADGPLAHTFSGSAGLVFNRNFTVGGAFFANWNEATPQSEADEDLYLDLRYGGLRLEYILAPDKPVSFSFPLIVGGGEAQMDVKDAAGESTERFGEGNFFFLEPGANVELNLWKHLRFYAGASYRYVAGLDYTYTNPGGVSNTLTGTEISAVNLNAGIRIGIF